MPGPGDYTVGWICAVETEYVAARAFLDEIHPGPASISRHDNNAYTLGKIGNHNVVMAVAPDGEYGTTSAAAVGRNMLHSFPNIKVGLMVGIGGGVPSAKNDIRLGDIVVSAPRNGYGGVLPYNYWDTIQAQSLQPLDHINQPPTLLRTAVNHLKAVYQTEGHGLEQSISRALSLKPRLQANYGRPSPTSDRLFRSDYVHPNDPKLSCGRHCASDPKRLVKRTPRGPHEDNPAIHLGLIASGNQLVKDAMIRDRLSRERDILCFEMEAAGLMNHFPCLVIRGICDYSDSHKAKDWQGYAAMTAAAYAKDLLANITASNVQTERKLLEVASNIAAAIDRTKVNTERTVVHLDLGRENEILDWLTPFDYVSVQREHFRKSLAGTCQWFLDSENFQQWLDTTEKTLFCTGIPGAGKTILASIVVDHLQQRFRDEPTLGLAYVYCDYERKDEQTPDHMFASILKQLAQRYSLHFSLPEPVRELYHQHLRTQGTTKSKVQPLMSEIMECLPSVVQLFSKVYIVVDALDEFQASRGRRSAFLKELLELQKSTGINILATSRKVSEVQNYFREATACEIAADKGDVALYVKDQMQYMPDFVQNDADLQKGIREISWRIHGMFSLAAACLKVLSEQPTAGHLRLAVPEWPQSAFEIYRRATQRIDEQGYERRRMAKMALACVIFACRSVSASEVQKAIAIKPETQTIEGQLVPDDTFLPSVDMIISVCQGLLSYDNNSKQFDVAHHTVRWYLVTEQLIHDSRLAGSPISRSGLYFGPLKGDRRVKANWLLEHMASNWDDAREIEKDCRNAAGRLIEEASYVKVGARSDTMLDRHMSWLLVSPAHDC